MKIGDFEAGQSVAEDIFIIYSFRKLVENV